MTYEQIEECLVNRHNWKKITYQDYKREYWNIKVWIYCRFKLEITFELKVNNIDTHFEDKYIEIQKIKYDIDKNLINYDMLAVLINEKANRLRNELERGL